MPETTNRKNNQYIPDPFKLPSTISPQRNVEIVLEPTWQWNMPSCPEFGNGFWTVWALKIDHQIITHCFGSTQCNITVSRKITIYLVRKKNQWDDYLKTMIIFRPFIHCINVHREPVSDYNFFEKSPSDKLQTIGNILIAEIFLFMKLMQDVLGPFDGASNQLRIKHHV